jgi:hypothetical protein
MRIAAYSRRCYSKNPPQYSYGMSRVFVDDYVLDVLMPDLVGHDRQPSAFVLYLRLWRLTGGGRRISPPLSLRELSDQTGLSKRAIQNAVDRLERRQLVAAHRTMPTAVPTYRVLKPWHR